jgi:hypothetical protein
MDDDARRQSVKAYFDGFAEKDMSRVPWAKDATLRTAYSWTPSYPRVFHQRFAHSAQP